MRKSMKLILVMAMALLMLALAACGGGDGGGAQAPAPQDAGEINVATYLNNSVPITDWDPSVEFSNGIITMHNMYETLLYYDSLNDSFEPRLATDYTSSDDGLTWTFKLREGVKFHDGTDMNAEAVRYSIQRTIDMNMGAAYIWDPVEAINVVDDYTVEFQLSYAAPLDLVVSAGYAAFIFSPTAVEAGGDAWFADGNECGTGPYMLQDNTGTEEVILTKFEDYWGGWGNTEGDQFDKVVIKRVSETASRRQMIEKGEGDITYSMPFEDVYAMRENADLTVTPTPSFQNLLFMLNCQKEPLNDPLVRQALSYAFPYEAVVEYAMGEFASQSRGTIPFGHWGHGADLFQYNFDLDKAKELLEQAGVGEFSMLLTYMSGEESEKKAAELYQSELAKIGITLEIRGLPWESQWDLAINGADDERQDILVMYWWPDYATPYSWLLNLFHTEEETLFNLNYYSNAEFDALVDEANSLSGTDRDAGEQMFIDAQRILVEEAPSIWAYDQQTVWITRNNFQGHLDNPIYPNVVFFYNCYRAE